MNLKYLSVWKSIATARFESMREKYNLALQRRSLSIRRHVRILVVFVVREGEDVFLLSIGVDRSDASSQHRTWNTWQVMLIIELERVSAKQSGLRNNSICSSFSYGPCPNGSVVRG
jgi:hypothetical protein